MNVELKGIELATHLAKSMTDLEFELLIRERIKRLFSDAHDHVSNLSESHNECVFRMSWTDNATWSVTIGESYSKTADTRGQVLSRCMADVVRIYEMKNANKLSLLLPAPVPIKDENEDDAVNNIPF